MGDGPGLADPAAQRRTKTPHSHPSRRTALLLCGALIQLGLSLDCALLDILGASHDRAQRFRIDAAALLLKIVNRVADPRRGLSIFFRCGVDMFHIAQCHRAVSDIIVSESPA
jgi:hypothetical protein